MIPIERNPSASQLRWFGLLWFPAFCALLGFFVLRHTDNLRPALWVWGVGAAIALIGIASRVVMRWIWVGLLTVTYPIGWVVSHLVLFLIYYLVLTPVALALKLAGRDAMNRRLDRDASSYWKSRPKRDAGSYFRQS